MCDIFHISTKRYSLKSYTVHLCTGLGWDWVDFLHRSWYEAVFWICAGNSIGSWGMFLLFLISVYTASRTFLPLTPPHQQRGWGCTGIRKGHSQASWAHWLKWYSIPHSTTLSMQNQGEEDGRGNVCRDSVLLP